MLPEKVDFFLGETDLDGHRAWRNFGGLTIEEAKLKFKENPLHYQEDFMFMGWNAFVYYFPVIFDYLSDIVPVNDTDDCLAFIIGCGIECQLQSNIKPLSSLQSTKIKHLSNIVKSKFTSDILEKYEVQRIQEQWALVDEIIEKKS